MNPNVNTYLNNLKHWQKELTMLRALMLECGLSETYKWKHPCYTYKHKNIAILHEFKDYCGISFFKGALLKDPENLLVQPTENMQAGRQLRFTNPKDIHTHKDTIKSYVFEAIEIEKQGLKVAFKKLSDYDVPEELQHMFSKNPDFETAFNKLTPGRQKGYLLHFTKPKQSKTRLSRIEKNIERIMDGYGLNDCVCGLSKRKPNCDGSHKQLLKVE